MIVIVTAITMVIIMVLMITMLKALKLTTETIVILMTTAPWKDNRAPSLETISSHINPEVKTNIEKQNNHPTPKKERF